VLAKLLSGGQTGVDRAALDAAVELGIPCGGWCPHGRRAEDGRVPERYPLTETPFDDHAQRTEWNVRDADATLILTFGPPAGGTQLTVDFCRRLGKPFLLIDLEDEAQWESGIDLARRWLLAVRPDALNVAGPRVSEAERAYELTRRFLKELLGRTAGDGGD
jgi:hypothetical protein